MYSITVKELFLTSYSKEIMNEYWEYFRTDNISCPPEWFERSFNRTFNEICSIEPLKSDAMIGGRWECENMIDVFVLMPGDETEYGLELNEWEEVLGYNVTVETAIKFSIERLLAAILHSMTFFGSTASEVHEKIVEFESDLKDMEAN